MLTKDEMDIVQICKNAGFSGRLFRSSSDAESWRLKDRRWQYCYKFYGERRRIHPEACRWHVKANDPKCRGCSRFTTNP